MDMLVVLGFDRRGCSYELGRTRSPVEAQQMRDAAQTSWFTAAVRGAEGELSIAQLERLATVERSAAPDLRDGR